MYIHVQQVTEWSSTIQWSAIHVQLEGDRTIQYIGHRRVISINEVRV